LRGHPKRLTPHHGSDRLQHQVFDGPEPRIQNHHLRVEQVYGIGDTDAEVFAGFVVQAKGELIAATGRFKHMLGGKRIDASNRVRDCPYECNIQFVKRTCFMCIVAGGF